MNSKTHPDELSDAFNRLLEKFAALEHERWSHWQQYMHQKCVRQSDGTLVIPADLVARWDIQMKTPYEALTEEMKESDRDQVRRYLPLIVELLNGSGSSTPE